METPFGPSGRVTLTYTDDTVVRVDKMGGPRIATETWKDEWIIHATDYIWLGGNKETLEKNMEILTVCYRFKPFGSAAKVDAVNEHQSQVLSVGNRWGFCSQVTGQSSNVLTLFFYSELLFGISVMRAVKCDQSVPPWTWECRFISTCLTQFISMSQGLPKIDIIIKGQV